MSAKFFEARRLDSRGSSDTEEWVVEEGPLQMRVNGKPFTVTLRTPGADRQLAMGLLFAEGLVDKPSDILSLVEEPANDKTTVWSATLNKAPAPEKISNRSLASTSSCGLCGKIEWEEPVVVRAHRDAPQHDAPQQGFPVASIENCFTEMAAKQELFARTGGCHAAAIFSVEGKLLAFGEDAGRHNAVDKAVGDLWSREKLNEAALLCLSGRVAYEIATKAHRAGIRVIAAVSAPSSMAVEFCRESDITLLGFCRGKRATIYSHPENLIESETTVRLSA